MAKKSRGNRIQVILECTEHKTSGLPGTSRYVTQKKQEKYTRQNGIEKIQSNHEKVYYS